MVCDAIKYILRAGHKQVLILILLEYGLRLVTTDLKPYVGSGLNPYSIGIWSATVDDNDQPLLNKDVLILILLEYGLRRPSWRPSWRKPLPVLILILLEYGLRPQG